MRFSGKGLTPSPDLSGRIPKPPLTRTGLAMFLSLCFGTPFMLPTSVNLKIWYHELEIMYYPRFKWQVAGFVARRSSLGIRDGIYAQGHPGRVTPKNDTGIATRLSENGNHKELAGPH